MPLGAAWMRRRNRGTVALQHTRHHCAWSTPGAATRGRQLRSVGVGLGSSGDREERVQLDKVGGPIWAPCQRRRFASGWRKQRGHRLRSRGQETLASSAKEEGRRWYDARGGRGLKRLGLGFFFYCFLSLSCRVLCRIFGMCPMLDSKTTFCGCND
ncbi:proline-rich receptor-like protein kinase PERK9 [Iris pallida]|uniref:Proline-rich receptor-like protein kinase PERK9 n=1 Tax=Iris pallida TaxID=29817 RepID=A0AAX6FAN5_IRIPA|nr:proline-rich receptor-like protein kinase PERK9 [Iris pallida]